MNLPPGLLGDPLATPRCPLRCSYGRLCRGLSARHAGRVSTASVGQGEGQELGPIVNVTPEAGQSAEFGLENRQRNSPPRCLTAHLVRYRSGATVLTVVSNEIPMVGLTRFELTFWGVPGRSQPRSDARTSCAAAVLKSPLACQLDERW